MTEMMILENVLWNNKYFVSRVSKFSNIKNQRMFKMYTSIQVGHMHLSENFNQARNKM